MFNLFNFIQDFIYQVINSEFWLFNPIDCGPLGYIAPIGIFGISSLIVIIGISIVRLVL